jgi:EF hand
MRAWMRSTLILAVVLGSPGINARAGDSPAAALQPPTSASTAQASQQVATSSATTPAGEGGAVDDEEAPADTQSAEPATPSDTQASGGLKTATDKIVDKFMLLDTDGSKGVSMNEYMAMVQMRAKARFAAMDANGDGQVTADEYRAFWKARMAQWYRLKH